MYLKHLRLIDSGGFFKVHKINKKADKDPGQSDTPGPGIEVELVDSQKKDLKFVTVTVGI